MAGQFFKELVLFSISAFSVTCTSLDLSWRRQVRCGLKNKNKMDATTPTLKIAGEVWRKKMAHYLFIHVEN